MHLAKVTYAIQTNSVVFNSGIISVIFMALKEQTVLQVYVHEIQMQWPIVCMKVLRLRFPAFSSVQRCCRRSWCAFAAFWSSLRWQHTDCVAYNCKARLTNLRIWPIALRRWQSCPNARQLTNCTTVDQPRRIAAQLAKCAAHLVNCAVDQTRCVIGQLRSWATALLAKRAYCAH